MISFSKNDYHYNTKSTTKVLQKGYTAAENIFFYFLFNKETPLHTKYTAANI
jgi:hypothetical protein